MKCIFRCAAGVIVLSVVVAGASVLVLGKHRSMELAKSLGNVARDSADSVIDQQAQLERQVTELRKSYPVRIAKLRNAVREAETNLAHVQRDQEICDEVLTLCSDDLATLRPQLDQALIAANNEGPYAIRFRGRIYGVGEAEGIASKAVETHERYTQRYNDLGTEAELINAEIGALNAELSELRAEQESFEAEYRAVMRELDRIRNNERLIEMAEQREAVRQSRESKTSDQLQSLSQLRVKLAEVRTIQEEQMRAHQIGSGEQSYEDRARLNLHPKTDPEEAKAASH